MKHDDRIARQRRVRARVLGAWLLAALATPAVAGEAGSADLASRVEPCMACHGAEGRASRDGYYPRIAGKPAGYLYQQLLNFRDGRRPSAMMAYFVDRQSEAYLREIAYYFADLHLPYPPPLPAQAPAAVLARGQQLVEQGDPGRELPACRSCHGARLTGVEPATPGLLGLPRDYLVAQLGAWRTGQRHAHAPDCMATVVQRLATDDLHAVAVWLASRPLPADTRPAAAPDEPLPLDCGSVEAAR